MKDTTHQPSESHRENGQLFAPTGRKINATQDWIPGNALIAGATRDRSGKLEIEWAGETKLCWDGQYTEEAGGGRIFLDVDGNAWRENQLSLGGEALRPAVPSTPTTDNPWAAIPHYSLGGIPENLPDENPALYRRIIAKRAVLASYEDGDEPGPCITDLLGDLRHLCDALGYDFATLDRAGARRYVAERTAMGT